MKKKQAMNMRGTVSTIEVSDLETHTQTEEDARWRSMDTPPPEGVDVLIWCKNKDPRSLDLWDEYPAVDRLIMDEDTETLRFCTEFRNLGKVLLWQPIIPPSKENLSWYTQ